MTPVDFRYSKFDQGTFTSRRGEKIEIVSAGHPISRRWTQCNLATKATVSEKGGDLSSLKILIFQQNLGAGESKIFFWLTFYIFNLIFWEMIEFEDHIFEMGWFNHQLEHLCEKRGWVKLERIFLFWEGMVWLLGWGTNTCFCLPRYKEFCLVKFNCFFLCLDWKGRVKTHGFSPKGKHIFHMFRLISMCYIPFFSPMQHVWNYNPTWRDGQRVFAEEFDSPIQPLFLTSLKYVIIYMYIYIYTCWRPTFQGNVIYVMPKVHCRFFRSFNPIHRHDGALYFYIFST